VDLKLRKVVSSADKYLYLFPANHGTEGVDHLFDKHLRRNGRLDVLLEFFLLNLHALDLVLIIVPHLHP